MTQGAGTRALTGLCTDAEVPSWTPWNWGSTLSAVPAKSLGAAGVGRRPSLGPRSPHVFDPSPRGSEEQAGTWRGLDSRLQPPGPRPRVLCVPGLRSAHARLFSAGQGHPGQRQGGSCDGKQVVGSAGRLELWEQDQELDRPRWAPPSKPPAPASRTHGWPGLLTFRSSLEISSPGSPANAGQSGNCLKRQRGLLTESDL